MNYFEHHIGDYAAATAHLSWDEDMAYTRLMRAYYHHERAIPDKDKYRLARAESKAQRLAVDTVLAEFFVQQADGWHQKRCDGEIERFQDKQTKAKRSATRRWSANQTHSECNANAAANGMPTHSVGNALQTPDTIPNLQTPEEIHPPTPRKRGAAAARLVSVDTLIADGVERQAAEDWLAVRKAKKLPLTPTAWEDVQAEAVKAGITAGAAVHEAVVNGWGGFKAGWLVKAQPPPRNGHYAEPEWAREKRERMQQLAGPAAAKPRQTAEIIDVIATARLG